MNNINTVELSKKLNIQYKSIKRIIEKYIDDFKIFGHLETIKGQSTSKGGRPKKMIYILNDAQKYLLITYLSNHKRIRIKKQDIIKNLLYNIDS
jgi:hypothetical protein